MQVVESFRCNKGHEFEHVAKVGWSGRKDKFLFDMARKEGYSAIVALDVNQLAAPTEARALKASGLHHIALRQRTSAKGPNLVARIIGSLVAAMPYVLDELEQANSQRIVEVKLLAPSSRHEVYDPRRERKRYPYWH